MRRLALFLPVALLAVAACTSTSENPPMEDPAPTGDTVTTVPADDSGGSTSTSSTELPTTTAGPTTTTGPPPHPDEDLEGAAAAAFRAWTTHLGSADFEAAWNEMSPTSQHAIGRDEFFNGISHAMAEGWGAWSVAENISFSLSEDEAERVVLEVSGTVSQEGMTEDRTVPITVVVDGDTVLMSPFEEFGNVAEGIRDEIEGNPAPEVPADSGEGRRVVYSNADQRVWLIEDDGSVTDSYRVSGKAGVPAPGTYEVYSRSELAYAGHDDITMRYMVRFARGTNLPIGFHAIPNDGSGNPLQSEDALGEYRSAGCVRQSLAHAAFLYEWAPEGTAVVVLP